MAATTPIEIWEKILKYAIAVPLFFDADPITNYGPEYIQRWQFEAPYWVSERNRNAFRRVCQSWNAFLQPYDHRYVRLSDIYRGHLPITVARMAIRFNIRPNLDGENDIQGLFSGMSGCLRELITRSDSFRPIVAVDGWKMEILEGDTVIRTDLYASFVEKAPKLRAVIELRDHFGKNNQAPHKAPGIRLLYAGKIWADGLGEPFTLSHLTTLYLSCISINTSLKNLRLPSLRHLSIEKISALGVGHMAFGGGPAIVSGEDVIDKMVEITQILGKNLITLHYQAVISTSLVSVAKLWPLIPHTERVQLPYWVGVALPTDHPTRVITLSMKSLVRFMEQDIPSGPDGSLFNHIPDWTDMRGRHFIVRMEIPWFTALMIRPFIEPRTPRVAISTWLAGHYSARGVKFTDSEGCTLNEYFVFLIQAFWKRGSLRPVARIPTRSVHNLTF